MSIFKGLIGRDLDYLLSQLKEQAKGGVDIVKDDEILFKNELTPFEKELPKGKRFSVRFLKQQATGHCMQLI